MKTKGVSNLQIICLWVPSIWVVNLRMNCASSSDENSINEYTSNKNGRTYEGLCFCISSCAQKKRLVARNVTIKVCSNLHNICLWVSSMYGENIKMNCGSSSDKIRINEYMSD